MRYIGIDLHKRFIVLSVINENERAFKPRRFECANVKAIRTFFENKTPFKAVVEASSSYRWLYDLLSPIGEVILAHPLKLRAIVTARAKTDKLDSLVLAKILRMGWIPEAYVPPADYQMLRDVTRARVRLVRHANKAKNALHALLASKNIAPPMKSIFTKKGLKWLSALDLGGMTDAVRDELVRRLDYFDREVSILDIQIARLAAMFPQVEAIADIHGIGLYTALLIIGEIGEPGRFRNAKQVGCYSGLTARVHQSGDHCYHGRISKQGSPWLRWALVQVAIKAVRADNDLKNMYTRIRKRSGKKIARVAVARKLACICWVRLRNWHRQLVAG